MHCFRFFLALFPLLRGVLSADLIGVKGPADSLPIQKPKKWSLYKTRFNQNNSTPLESLAYAGSVANLDELWERLGGSKAFLQIERIDYDIFDFSRSFFKGIRAEKSLNLKALKRVYGTLASFSVEPRQSHFFDPVLRSILAGDFKSSSLSKVFGVSICRQYRRTLIKFWTFEERDCRPLYESIKSKLKVREIGKAFEVPIFKYCRSIINSSGFATMNLNRIEYDSKCTSKSEENLVKESSEVEKSDSDYIGTGDDLSESSNVSNELDECVTEDPEVFASSPELGISSNDLEIESLSIDSKAVKESNSASFEKGSPISVSEENLVVQVVPEAAEETSKSLDMSLKEILAILDAHPEELKETLRTSIPREKLTLEYIIDQIISMPVTEEELFNRIIFVHRICVRLGLMNKSDSKK